jgi:glucose/mannose-6-phosphate isomerase
MSDSSIPVFDSLNDPQRRLALDPHDMLGLVLKFPQQCREGIAIGRELPVEKTARPEIRNVVFTGLGGSAIGADFARSLMEECGTAPMQVNRDYTLPNYVGPHTLVVAGSYSGNTEETLAAYAAAGKAGAQRAVVTSGGTIRKLAEEAGDTVALVPGGQPPRSATGYMLFPMLGYLAQRGLFERELATDLEETVLSLDTLAIALGPNVPTAQNPAKQLALALYGKIPVLYGSQGYRGAVAVRWKGQFNENAKLAAFANVFPEQNHNEILAWTLATRQAQNWAVLFLRDKKEATEMPRIAHRVEVTKGVIGTAAEIHEVWAEGDSLLARMMYLAHYADYVTVYLAMLNAICPTDIASIDHLKTEMAKI